MVVAVVNRKGGSAKTTTALHLAAALADRADGAVALIDLDAENRSALDYAAHGHLPITVTDPATWAAGLNRQAWAHIVADGHARPTAAQLADLAGLADLLLLPTPPDALSLRVLARLLADVRATGARYAVVLVMAPPRPSREPERALRDLRAGGVPVLDTVVPRAAAVGRAARAGRLAWNVPGGRRLAPVFGALAEEVLAYA